MQPNLILSETVHDFTRWNVIVFLLNWIKCPILTRQQPIESYVANSKNQVAKTN